MFFCSYKFSYQDTTARYCRGTINFLTIRRKDICCHLKNWDNFNEKWKSIFILSLLNISYTFSVISVGGLVLISNKDFEHNLELFHNRFVNVFNMALKQRGQPSSFWGTVQGSGELFWKSWSLLKVLYKNFY